MNLNTNMDTKQPIDQPTDEIKSHLQRWRINRAILKGEYAVKAMGEEFLPRIHGMDDDSYNGYLKRSPFFPGAQRTHEGLMGLMNRKEPSLEAPENLTAIFETITMGEGDSYSDLAEDTLSELLATGFCGLYVDHPTTTEGLTVAEAERGNYRPFIGLYKAESILEVSTSVIRNRKRLTRVRLLEDDGNQVRELLLEDEVYRVIIHRKTDKDQWTVIESFTPLKAGRPIEDIPFIVVTPDGRSKPSDTGPLDAVININRSLFLAQADAKNSRYYSSAPMLTIIGAAKQESVVIAPGKVLQFPYDPEAGENAPQIQVKYTEHAGSGQASLDAAVAVFKDEMAAVGSRMLATEKSAVEAAETHAIRRASENSALARIANKVSRKIEAALNIVADWMGASEEVKFAINTDFIPAPMSAQDLTAITAVWLANGITHETYLDTLKEGEILPATLDVDFEVESVKQSGLTVDRPQLGGGFDANGQ